MTTVNGIDMHLYALDTATTVVKRIASQLKTIPEYLSITDATRPSDVSIDEYGIDLLHTPSMTAIDILKIIQDYSKETAKRKTLSDFVDQIKTLKPSLSVVNNFLPLFIAYSASKEAGNLNKIEIVMA